MTLAIIEAGGGQWMVTISTPNGTLLSRSTPYLNDGDARRTSRRIVEGFGSGTVVDGQLPDRSTASSVQ